MYQVFRVQGNPRRLQSSRMIGLAGEIAGALAHEDLKVGHRHLEYVQMNKWVCFNAQISCSRRHQRRHLIEFREARERPIALR